MSTMTDDELRRQIQAKLQEMPPADWVIEMIAHYQREGYYRPEDLRRLLGDPNRAVEVGPNPSLSSLLSRADEARQ